MSSPAGFRHVYVHVPFCVTKCAYCDFYSVPCRGTDAEGGITTLFEQYDEAVLAQARDTCLAELCRRIETLYVGGGTPTVMGGRLVGLVRSLVEQYGLGRDAEVTVEANPESADPELLEALARAGVTRMSVGVQSFDDAVLSTLGRVHDASAAERAVARVVREGMRASLDLICAVPGQGMRSWRDTLERTIATGSEHVSVYPLQVEEGTPMERAIEDGELPEPDPNAAADMMLLASEILTDAGFERYEVASYALPGAQARHNVAYWTGAPYLGLGPAAHSMCDVATAVAASVPGATPGLEGRVRFSTVADVGAFVREPTGPLADFEFLSPRSAQVEDLMLGMRLVRGVATGDVAAARLEAVFEGLRDEGLTHLEGGRWALTERGWLLGNEVFGRIWDAR